jgi:2-dehydro-3-deoxygluconokinase
VVRRVGIYYWNRCFYASSKVIYDRAHSAIAEADAADFDFDAIMEVLTGSMVWYHSGYF